MNDMNFGYNDLDNVDAHTGSRVVVDSGDYNVMISDINMESNKHNNGHNIVVTYSILDGDFAGSEVKEWLAVVNKNDTAERIARSKLKALFVVSNNKNASSFTELNGQVIRIRILKKENSYVDNNGNQRDGYQTEVTMYMDQNGNNSDGKPVKAYTGPAVAGSNKQKQASSSNTNSGNSYGGSNGGSNQFNDDDEIPF